jgi:MFS family permease
MVPFLHKFFPSVLRKAAEAKTNMYCVFDSQLLTSFTSSLYIAGLAASLVASRVTAAIGRKNTIVIGGCTFFAGAAINGGAANVAMLILGRILLGFGVGFTNQVCHLYVMHVGSKLFSKSSSVHSHSKNIFFFFLLTFEKYLVLEYQEKSFVLH